MINIKKLKLLKCIIGITLFLAIFLTLYTVSLKYLNSNNMTYLDTVKHTVNIISVILIIIISICISIHLYNKSKEVSFIKWLMIILSIVIINGCTAILILSTYINIGLEKDIENITVFNDEKVVTRITGNYNDKWLCYYKYVNKFVREEKEHDKYNRVKIHN